MQLSTVAKLMRFTRVCPCCGQASDPEAWGDASTEPQADEVPPLFRHNHNPLDRFTDEAEAYAQAMVELRAGRKKGHWIWFVFPQMNGLGYSDLAIKYGIKDIAEAKAFLQSDHLSDRLRDAFAVLWNQVERGMTLEQVIPDELDRKKIKSCATLFDAAAHDLGIKDAIYGEALELLFDGKQCQQTITILDQQEAA